MKKIMLIVCLCPFLVTGQERTRLGINASADINMPILDAPMANPGVEFRYKPGFVLGMDVGISISTRLGFHVGMSFAQRGYRSNRYSFNQVNYLEQDVAEYYLEVPIGLAYNFKIEKLNCFVLLGTAPTIRFGRKSSYNEYDSNMTFIAKREGEFDMLSQEPEYLSMIGVISAGIKYNPTNRVGLMIAPIYRRSYLAFSDRYNYRVSKFHSLGINTGVYVRF